jgi:hypothetical protein
MNSPPKIDPVVIIPRVCMDEALPHLHDMAHLVEVCRHYSEIDDAAGFYVACEKIIEHARELAKIQKTMRLSFNARNK